MITINSNISAKVAQNNLNNNQLNLQGNMRQLTTGLRINSAADDAAGMQIANRMQTQIQGLEVAQRNAGDGISMAQTAEAGMTESTNIMNRVRDLAMQSYNDTNAEEDREAIQKEVDHLQDEINRIANSTNFAGINLLDGTSENLQFQIGETANDTISFGINSVTGADLGEGIQEAKLAAVDENDQLKEAVSWHNPFVDIEAGTPVSEAVEQLNNALGDENIDAEVVLAIDPVKQLEIIGHEQELDMIEVIGIAPAGNTISGRNELNVDSINVETQAGATKAMIILDEALGQLDDERANLGAVQNRLESTINNLTNIEENLSISQSRIMDADFAQQTVEMTSNQMLMQAGTSVLTQAKSMPQYATMLL